ncbi:hypothetical protein I3843_08G034700 [Carya illinoinensis]|nr:hypothetical protein I3843_08G034700 [Carya illinoinensis]
MDPTTPRSFDNAYYRNLQQGKGLFTSDQVLFTDARSKATVNLFASNNDAFRRASVSAITKLGSVGVKTRNQALFWRDIWSGEEALNNSFSFIFRVACDQEASVVDLLFVQGTKYFGMSLLVELHMTGKKIALRLFSAYCILRS